MTAGTKIKEPSRLSYSSLNSYVECGERWRLERGFKLNGSTWFATIAGSAIHNITEAMDRVEAGQDVPIPTFADEFERLLKIEADRGIEVKASGALAKTICKSGGPNKKDKEWWLHWGPLYIESWTAWKAEQGWTIAIMPDGQLGIEVKIDSPFAGEPHLGFIDRVYVTPDGQLVIVDLKTGKEPASKLQLGVYGSGLFRKYGIRADWACYWMAGKGELTPLTDITQYSEEYLDEQYAMAWRGIRAGIFLPNVTSMCVGCGVREFCRAVGGRRSVEIPIETVVEGPNVKV